MVSDLSIDYFLIPTRRAEGSNGIVIVGGTIEFKNSSGGGLGIEIDCSAIYVDC